MCVCCLAAGLQMLRLAVLIDDFARVRDDGFMNV